MEGVGLKEGLQRGAEPESIKGEKSGKHVEGLISRDDCILGEEWRDNACLKKRKVRGGKGEGCGQNKMSNKERPNET